MKTLTKQEPHGKIPIPLLGRAMPVILFLSFLTPGVFAESPAFFNPNPGSASVLQDRTGERDEDFQFSAPSGFLGFRIGRFFPDANGDVFDFITDELTLEKNDFRAWNLVFEGGFAVNDRVEVVFDMEYMKRTKNSEVRHWEYNDGRPITQKTYYSQLPLTAGVKILLIPRGRQVGRYAWIPSRFVPYVGAGFGIEHYRFGQSGEFVDDFDPENPIIFTAELESSGWPMTGYLGGGMDYNVVKHTYLTLDIRYSWARPELERNSFEGFDPLELSGFRVSAGVQWYF